MSKIIDKLAKIEKQVRDLEADIAQKREELKATRAKKEEMVLKLRHAIREEKNPSLFHQELEEEQKNENEEGDRGNKTWKPI